MKIKHNGQKIKVRLQIDGECIKPNSLQTFGNITDEVAISKARWFPSKCVGERIDGVHSVRTYIEVLSTFYMPESSDEYTEPDY